MTEDLTGYRKAFNFEISDIQSIKTNSWNYKKSIYLCVFLVGIIWISFTMYFLVIFTNQHSCDSTFGVPSDLHLNNKTRGWLSWTPSGDSVIKDFNNNCTNINITLNVSNSSKKIQSNSPSLVSWQDGTFPYTIVNNSKINLLWALTYNLTVSFQGIPNCGETFHTHLFVYCVNCIITGGIDNCSNILRGSWHHVNVFMNLSQNSLLTIIPRESNIVGIQVIYVN